MANQIPSATIDTLARSIFKEASDYGFAELDMVRLINELMDLCSGPEATNSSKSVVCDVAQSYLTDQAIEFPLVGSRVKIRQFQGEDDVRLLEKWLPDKYGRFFMLSCATAQAITVDGLINGRDNHLGIVTTMEDVPIGAMAYLDHSKNQRRAELRKLIGDPQSRGKGLAEDATRLWIKYGINTLGLEKIYVSTLQTQVKNILLNESVGFRVEGLLRQEVLIDDVRYDVLRMGLWFD